MTEQLNWLFHSTDSAYIAFSSSDWESLVKPEKRAQYEAEKHKWFPRDDTPEHAAYDRRTPMLFKEEWKGDQFIGKCVQYYY